MEVGISLKRGRPDFPFSRCYLVQTKAPYFHFCHQKRCFPLYYSTRETLEDSHDRTMKNEHYN